MKVHLYLVTEFKNRSCFSNGKQGYRMLCDQCVEELKNQYSLHKETKVTSKCHKCGYKEENKND